MIAEPNPIERSEWLFRKEKEMGKEKRLKEKADRKKQRANLGAQKRANYRSPLSFILNRSAIKYLLQQSHQRFFEESKL